jgi:hypothetical protein
MDRVKCAERLRPRIAVQGKPAISHRTVDNSNRDENQHMHFVVFRNERGEAETAICPIRDAKGMTMTPEGSVPCLEE